MKTIIQLVIQTSLKNEVLTDLHERAVGEHLGIDKTLGQLHKCNYWPGYYIDICEWCRNCSTCASHKSPTAKACAPLQPIVTSHPLQLVVTDILGTLPESSAGNLYVQCTLYVLFLTTLPSNTKAHAIPNQKAVTAARKMVDVFLSAVLSPRVTPLRPTCRLRL